MDSEKLLEILLSVWYREISADDALEEIEQYIEVIDND